jgi:hypothetical protein
MQVDWSAGLEAKSVALQLEIGRNKSLSRQCPPRGLAIKRLEND